LEVLLMTSMPEIIPVTDLRQDAAGVLRRVQSSRKPVVITQRGRAAAVILSMDTYQQGEHERELLHLLLRGEQEIAVGAGHDLDEVLAEADALLGDDTP
jgi:prevent-host-death family protein